MGKFYVYVHRRLSNHSVFYVGKGINSRAWKKSGRTSRWKLVADEGYIVEIVQENLNLDSALSLEESLISQFNPCANVRKQMRVKSMDFDIFNLYLKIDESSPSGLVWKDTKRARNYKLVGKPAGSILSIRPEHQVWQVGFNRKNYYAHRIIYLLANGSIPEDRVVNHIDNDPLNNKLSNLEICSLTENNQRTKVTLGRCLSVNNTSGYTNIYREIKRTTKPKEYFLVMRKVNGKIMKKRFSITAKGEDTALALAIKYRDSLMNYERDKL